VQRGLVLADVGHERLGEPDQLARVERERGGGRRRADDPVAIEEPDVHGRWQERADRWQRADLEEREVGLELGPLRSRSSRHDGAPAAVHTVVARRAPSSVSTSESK
jgi:hypothetical protein